MRLTYRPLISQLQRQICSRQAPQRRSLLTLAIETSCDDTAVAILSKTARDGVKLHYHQKVTSDNRQFGGVHPVTAVESHYRALAGLVQESLRHLPLQDPATAHLGNALLVQGEQCVDIRQKPSFVAVTRGPGMRASLQTGIDVAKGLAVAWGVSLIGVHHMQAHALTPRLMSALKHSRGRSGPADEVAQGHHEPSFPFLTFLVSGGHTMLLRSSGLCEHEILADSMDIAIGDALDKCARLILPADLLARSKSVMYGQALEEFAFPCANTESNVDYSYTLAGCDGESVLQALRSTRTTDHDWVITPPLSTRNRKSDPSFSYASLYSQVERIIRANPTPSTEERRTLAREVMRVAFEHLASRLVLVLNSNHNDEKHSPPNALVLSGGVASNQYLRRIFRNVLDACGHAKLEISCPPPELCTDNAAMIAWAGTEMFEAGWRSRLDMLAIRRWSLDPGDEDGGVLGAQGWFKV